jgi:hypothetical protein
MGLPGPDAGRGGKHLLLSPDYDGDVPDGYYVARSRSYKVILAVRMLPPEGDLAAGLAALRGVKVYPLATGAAPEPMAVEELAGRPLQSTPVQWEEGIDFWIRLQRVIDDEALLPGARPMYGLLASLGIEKGKPFVPDARLRRILDRAARQGLQQMLVAAFASDREDRLAWEDRRWEWASLAPLVDFESPAGIDLDARDRWFVQAVGMSPAMLRREAGAGSTYWLGHRDAQGRYLDGGKTYKLTVPGPVPARLFWSVTVYDAKTRSEIRAPQSRAALRSLIDHLEPDANGDFTLYFGPAAPAGQESRWVQTNPGQAWFSYFRIYGPEAAAFDGAWRPGDYTEMLATPVD